MSSHFCKNDHDDFCFVCGNRILQSKKKINQRGKEKKIRHVDGSRFAEEYKNKFQRDVSQRNKEWSPNVSCNLCYSYLMSGKMNLVSPMEWHVPTNHPNDCYFCQTVVPPGINKRRIDEIQYADVLSVKRPRIAEAERDDVSGDETSRAGGEVINPFNIGDSAASEAVRGNVPAASGSGASGSAASASASTSSGSVFIPPKHFIHLQTKKPKENIEITQEILNDIVRDMDIPMGKSELLASRLKDIGMSKGKFTFLSLTASLSFSFFLS